MTGNVMRTLADEIYELGQELGQTNVRSVIKNLGPEDKSRIESDPSYFNELIELRTQQMDEVDTLKTAMRNIHNDSERLSRAIEEPEIFRGLLSEEIERMHDRKQ